MAKDPLTDGSGGWPVPVFDSTSALKDVGSYGLRQYGGWVREEFLRDLQGRQAARVYREMSDNSAVIGGIVFAIKQLMRRVDWRTEPASDKPEAQAEADFADSLRFDMTHTWEDFLDEALSMLVYGYAPHEIVYKRRNGRKPAHAEQPSSLYDDGRIGLRRLPIRGQDTILKWFFDPNGQVQGMTQQPWFGSLIDLPIEKMLLFRPGAHKNNPEGRSILRNSYRPYYFIKRLEEQEAIMLERMSGVPEVRVPNALLEAAAAGDTNATAALAAWKKLVTNVRVDEQMGLVTPSDRYPGPTGGASSELMYEFRLVTPQSGGKSGADFETPIERYKLEVLMTVLADFIQLGHSARGTQNLALSKVDMFFQAIEGWMNAVASVLNRYLLPRIWGLNGLDLALMPQYVPDLAQRIDLDALGNFILHTAQAGMTMFPDPDLENWIREAAGMPDVSEEDAYAATAGATDTEALKRILKASCARRIKRVRAA